MSPSKFVAGLSKCLYVRVYRHHLFDDAELIFIVDNYLIIITCSNNNDTFIHSIYIRTCDDNAIIDFSALMCNVCKIQIIVKYYPYFIKTMMAVPMMMMMMTISDSETESCQI